MMADELDIGALTEYLSSQEDVLAAYLFGSQAAGKARPSSDVDVAVLLRDEDSIVRLYRRLELTGGVSDVCGREADVIVLNDAPPILQHQILKARQMIFERDRHARVEFEVMAGKIYADLEPQREFFRRALFREIKEAGLGGR
jgi:predicted nucleotidyltransferase